VDKIYSSRRNKSLEGTEIQKLKMTEWFVEDKKLLNTSVNILKEIEKFMASDLSISDINGGKLIKQITDWVKIKNPCESNIQNTQINDTTIQGPNPQNIILKNKIIKLDAEMFSLRSLGVQADLELLMAGESCFYIFSRIKDEFNPEVAICYINKELESSRKFINFAIIEENSKDNSLTIKALKKQEIPKQGIISLIIRKLC
jgi:hypothetical protein